MLYGHVSRPEGLVGLMGALLVRHEPMSAALIRHRIAEDLNDHGISPDSIDEVVLVASELVGNAIRHAQPSASGTITVSWDVDDSGVTIRVADASDESPRPRIASADEPGGRGLTIVEAMADDWGYQRSQHGKEVWAHVPVRGDAMSF
jgi:serine/threonine-protein kinase RsbW